MEYLLALICGLAPFAMGFALNRRFGKKRLPRVAQPADRGLERAGKGVVTADIREGESKLCSVAEVELVHARKRLLALSSAATPKTASHGSEISHVDSVELKDSAAVLGRSAPPTPTRPPALPDATDQPTAELAENNAASPVETGARKLRALPPALKKVRTKAADAHRFIEPEYFKRHSGVPGFLYLARNDARRPGLYKIGYTTQLPQSRIGTLNAQLKDAVDLGSFRLIHSVPVGSSYDMEQALFAVLKGRRVIDQREFFFGDEKTFMRAMDALVRMPQDNGESINDFLKSDPWAGETVPVSSFEDCAIPPRSSATGGWLYLCANFWHEPDTFYYSVTQDSPGEVVRRLNEAQKALTSQLGFYRIVACHAVASTGLARQQAQVLLAPFKLDTRKNFVKLSLSRAREIFESIDADAVVQVPPALLLPVANTNKSSASQPIVVTEVKGRAAHKSWSAWTNTCSGCGVLLRYQGQIGQACSVVCPCCECQAIVRIGAQRVIVQ